MSLKTFSKFYYGHEVTTENNLLDFDEGSGEVTAELEAGFYSLTEYAAEIQRALNDAGALTYTVTIDRDLRELTISASAVFSLLVTTGSHVGASVWAMAGFSGADRTGASTYTGDLASGSVYYPQFILQDHIASDKWRQAADASVNRSASGRVEVVKFGSIKYVQFSIKFATDIDQGYGGPIRSNPNGVSDLEAFMNYLITKGPFEYMPDESDSATFETLILEASPDFSEGTGFKLKELYDKNLPEVFETGILKARVI